MTTTVSPLHQRYNPQYAILNPSLCWWLHPIPSHQVWQWSNCFTARYTCTQLVGKYMAYVFQFQ